MRRIGLLTGMAAYLVIALAIPEAFAGSSVAFAVAYLVIVAVHLGLYQLTASAGSRAGILRIARSNVTGAVLVLAGAIAGGTAQVLLWALAVLLMWVVPLTQRLGGFDIDVPHFVERHGLLVIVAIGESIVAIGIGAEGQAVDLALAAVATLALALSALFWWTYFVGDDAAAEVAMEAAPGDARGRLALLAFGFCHLLLLGGIICAAAGVKAVLAHAGDPLAFHDAALLAGGASGYLLGDAAFRHTLRIGNSRIRVATAIVVLVAIPVGTAWTATAMLALLVGLYAAGLALDGQQVPPGTRRSEARAST